MMLFSLVKNKKKNKIKIIFIYKKKIKCNYGTISLVKKKSLLTCI